MGASEQTREQAIQAARRDGHVIASASICARQLLPVAAEFSIAPISNFKVGAIAVGKSGQHYLGANMEFPGLPLSASLHAEQSAVLNAWIHREKEITELHISDSPCGHCRQFLRELSNVAQLQVYASEQQYPAAELLPAPFGPERSLGTGLLDHNAPQDARASHASPLQQAFDKSYAPYTGVKEACLIDCADGSQFLGSSAESAAFNPTVISLITALNQRNLSAHRNSPIISSTLAINEHSVHSTIAQSEAILANFTESKLHLERY